MRLEKIFDFFASLKLSVVVLTLSLVLVFVGTLAQEPLGLYDAQARYFRSFFVDAAAFYGGLHKLLDMLCQGFGYPLAPLDGASLKARSGLPVFPGGYLIGGLLIINLFAAHLRYYKPGQKKYGIAMIHLGIVLLLAGQLLTDLLSTESSLHLRNLETKNYTESGRQFELAIIDTTDADSDKVVAIPGRLLSKRRELSHAELPFMVQVRTFHPNSLLSEKSVPGYEEIKTTAGFGSGLWWRSLPNETVMERRDMPSGIIELTTPQGSLGTFLISGFLTRPQQFNHNGRSYLMELRPERFYKPFSLHLVEFKHDKYPGTDIPKNFSSRVRLKRPETGEDREVLIYMNNPLRYAGDTYYQASFDPDDQGTILQVVHNPSWLTPYFACVIVAAGLIFQFLKHLIGFATKRKVK